MMEVAGAHASLLTGRHACTHTGVQQLEELDQPTDLTGRSRPTLLVLPKYTRTA